MSGDGRFVNPQLQHTPSTDTFYLPALKAQLEFAGLQLISNTGYLHRDNTTHEDFTTATPVAFGLPWPLVPQAADLGIITTTQNVLSEDLRLQSADTRQPLEWTLGFSYVESRERNYNPEISPYLPTLVPGTVLLPGNLSYIGDERATDKQVALYGQLNYHLTARWSIIAGARIAHDSDDYSIFQTGPFAGGTSFVAGKQSETVKDPKFGINFQLDDNNLLYVSAAKGDRVGGVNAPFPLTGACLVLLNEIGLNGIPPTFSGDSLWSYEIGSKNRLLDGHFVLQASAFHIDWSNVQQSVSLPPSLCPGNLHVQSRQGTSNGVDLQLAARSARLELGLSVGYTNAKNPRHSVPSTLQYVTPASRSTLQPRRGRWCLRRSIHLRSPAGTKLMCAWTMNSTARIPGPLPSSSPNNIAVDPNFIPNPSTNVLNAHFGAIWNGWDTSIYALNVLNSHPLLYNTALETAQFVGPTYTIRP